MEVVGWGGQQLHILSMMLPRISVYICAKRTVLSMPSLILTVYMLGGKGMLLNCKPPSSVMSPVSLFGVSG